MEPEPTPRAEFLAQPAPRPTVDAIIERDHRVLLIQRKFPPPGWALPGGFVDVGESCEQAVVRETLEETGLRVTRLRQLKTYSDPSRDPRLHTVGIIYVVEADGEAVAEDDAAAVRFFAWHELPDEVAFDHRQVLEDYRSGDYRSPWLEWGTPPD